MIVDPYKRTPLPPTVALLTRELWQSEQAVLDEHGVLYDLDRLPEHTRVWCSYDTAHRLTAEGDGEALCWRGEETRWRHRRFEEGWRRRPSDVHVLRLPLPDDDPRTILAGLAGWRDWLAAHGAAPVGTTGSSAWSLLRSKLERTLFCSVGDRPPLLQTLGGRQELGPAGPGAFRGPIRNVDLKAAYASELGALPYGGRWFKMSDLPSRRSRGSWALQNRPVFARARVEIPDGLAWGPLPRRPRRRQSPLEAHLGLVERYPCGTRLQGVWTWQELMEAEQAGCRILKVHEMWVHLGAVDVFAPWWEAIVEGRALPGWAGVLAKMTGNALWGRFCMDARVPGERTIRGLEGRSMAQRPLPFRGGQLPAHDLAETVSGRVRAKLYRLMRLAGDRLLSAHTDGAWTYALDEDLPEGWRVKQQTSRLDLWDPQVLRYRGPDGDDRVVFAGVPAYQAEQAFEDLWTAFESSGRIAA